MQLFLANVLEQYVRNLLTCIDSDLTLIFLFPSPILTARHLIIRRFHYYVSFVILKTIENYPINNNLLLILSLSCIILIQYILKCLIYFIAYLAIALCAVFKFFYPVYILIQSLLLSQCCGTWQTARALCKQHVKKCF